MSRLSPGPDPGEFTSLGERMEYLQAVRVAFAAMVAAAALLAPSTLPVSGLEVTAATAAYLLFSGTVEAIRWLTRRRALSLVALSLLVDGLYLAWVLYSSGGATSPFRFLPVVHLVAVTLLASYRTGLKIAAWHSLLLLSVQYALGPESFSTAAVALLIAAYWLAAGVTSLLSYVNERELRRAKNELQCLAVMASELETEKDPEVAGRILLDRLAATFNLRRAVLLAAPHGNALALLASRGLEEPLDQPDHRDPIVSRAWSAREPLLVKKLDPEVDRRLASLLPFARNLVVLPLFSEGQPIGLIAAESERPTIERRALEMLNQFATHGALAIRNAWLVHQIQRMADTDPLTGIANRRSFELMLAREAARSGRGESPLSLMMIDVDHFKEFNDQHGHLAGDLALKAVATGLDEACRSFDTVARYGGEEFAVILPDCSPSQGEGIAERLRASVAALDVGAPISVSIGIATFPVHAANPHDLVRAADQALYESKRRGRDRVTSFGEGLHLPADIIAALREELR